MKRFKDIQDGFTDWGMKHRVAQKQLITLFSPEEVMNLVRSHKSLDEISSKDEFRLKLSTADMFDFTVRGKVRQDDIGTTIDFNIYGSWYFRAPWLMLIPMAAIVAFLIVLIPESDAFGKVAVLVTLFFIGFFYIVAGSISKISDQLAADFKGDFIEGKKKVGEISKK